MRPANTISEREDGNMDILSSSGPDDDVFLGKKSITYGNKRSYSTNNSKQQMWHNDHGTIDLSHGSGMNCAIESAGSRSDNRNVLAALRATQIVKTKAILPAGKSISLASLTLWLNPKK